MAAIKPSVGRGDFALTDWSIEIECALFVGTIKN